MSAQVPTSVRLKPGQAARILGVGTQVLRTYADAGLLTRDAQGLYGATEVRALKAQHDAQREERRVRREQRARDRAQQSRERARQAT